MKKWGLLFVVLLIVVGMAGVMGANGVCTDGKITNTVSVTLPLQKDGWYGTYSYNNNRRIPKAIVKDYGGSLSSNMLYFPLKNAKSMEKYCFYASAMIGTSIYGKEIVSVNKASCIDATTTCSSPGDNGYVYCSGESCVVKNGCPADYCGVWASGKIVCDVTYVEDDCEELDCADYYKDKKCGFDLSAGTSGFLNCVEGDHDEVPYPDSTKCIDLTDPTGETNCVESDSCELKCLDGFENCDGSWLNGCVDVVSDVNNCGGCGSLDSANICDTGDSCVAGDCIPPVIPVADFNYWTNMNGVKFDNGADVGLNWSVRLVSNVAPDYNITKGGSVYDTISEKYWMASELGSNYGFTSDSGDSENLINVVEKSAVDNDPLEIEVVNPACGENFTVNTEKTIELKINDSDDLVFGNVTIGDLVINFNNIINNTVRFNYTFTDAGNIQIIVQANSTNDDKFKAIVNVMVVDTSKTDYYVAACIDEPKNFERFDSSIIFLNASSSRGLKFNVSDGSYEVIEKESLNFSWQFELSDGTSGVPCIGLGSGSCPDDTAPIYAYNRSFPTVDDNKILLSVSIPGI